MDSTGRIHDMLELGDLSAEQKKLLELVAIPPEEVERLKAATTEERLAWYRKQASYNFSASKEERNAAKAQRRKRRGK